MKSPEIQPIENNDRDFFDQYVDMHGGAKRVTEQWINYIRYNEENISSVVFNAIEQVITKTSDSVFEDETRANAEAFMQGYSLGFALLANLNFSKRTFYDLDTYYGVYNNLLNLCDDLVNDKYPNLPEDITPHDVLMGTSTLGLKTRPGLEEYIDELLDSSDLSISIARHRYFRSGVGLTANIFASFESYENPYDEIESEFESLLPNEATWEVFMSEIQDNG